MKKRPRCPVCGSLHIEESKNSNTAEKKQDIDDQKKSDQKKHNWKCFDCYRIFEKPDDAI